MGLFGGGGKKETKTTVKPDARVEAILKHVATLSDDMEAQKFIEKKAADLNDDQKAAIKQLQDSGTLKQVAQIYTGRTGTALDQFKNIDDRLKALSSSGVTSPAVDAFKQAVTNSPLAKQVDQQSSKVSLGSGLGQAGRRAALVNAGQNQALTNLSRGTTAQNLGIGTLIGNRTSALGTLGSMTGLAGGNLALGQAGVNASQQAAQNQLLAGNLQQANQQNLYNNQWQNDIGRSSFDWDQLKNKMNVLNQISPMAGYTTTGTSPGINKGQQLLGGAIGLVGALGQAGAFSQPSDAATQNAWTSYNNAGGQTGVAGPMPASSSYGNLSQAPQQTQGFATTPFGSAVNSAWHGLSNMFSSS